MDGAIQKQRNNLLKKQLKINAMNDLNLVIGTAYNVKHINNKQTVRRIFKGTEKRFDLITCYVFTGKVGKNVSLVVEPTKNPDMNFFHWKGVKHVPNEISIPYYDIRKVEPV